MNETNPEKEAPRRAKVKKWIEIGVIVAIAAATFFAAYWWFVFALGSIPTARISKRRL